ncbi:MAG: HIT family protein [Pseudomonadota bacterium]
MAEFILNPRLVTATLPVGDLPLCRVLVMDDHRYPWLLVVPRLNGVEELWDLEANDRATMMDEVTISAKILRDLFEANRINVADIGNRAPQMHIHVVGRRTDDAAWPKVVWSRPYEHWTDRQAFADRQHILQKAFSAQAPFTPIGHHVDSGVDRL